MLRRAKNTKTKLKKSSIVIGLIIVMLLIVGAGLLLYFLKFNGTLSRNGSDWSNFASFISPFIAFANLIIIAWLSIQVYNYNRENDSAENAFQKTIEKPILTFRKSKDSFEGRFWEVCNIGKGAAINLRIGTLEKTGPTAWITPVKKCYSLGSGEKRILDWLPSANIICVTYEDVFENKYVSITGDSESHIRSIDEDFKEIKIQKYIFTKKILKII